MLAPAHDREVGLEVRVAHAAHEGEGGREAALVEVVEEQAADAARLAAVAQEEVLVALLLEARVGLGPEGGAGAARDLVPVHAVFLEAVERRQVEAAAEPPGRGPACGRGLEEAQVQMRGGHVGVARVRDQRDRDRLEGRAGELGAPRGRGRRERLAARVGEVDGGLLEEGAVLEHPRTREGVARALEALLAEAGAAVLRLEGRADPVLQAEEPGADLAGSRKRAARHLEILTVDSRRGVADARPVRAAAARRES